MASNVFIGQDVLLKLSYILEVGHEEHDFDIIGNVIDDLKELGNGNKSIIERINKSYECLKEQE